MMNSREAWYWGAPPSPPKKDGCPLAMVKGTVVIGATIYGIRRWLKGRK